ncbi:unnamed protein product [Prorocentrum cordatum]|uniref:Uncharacterized protein n=1 Tax=Prorocentrum cordatum TaxID=2364126 RepID=A0ABN9VB14_9DINO|nr:unnamed protein product [Polarella glacialis]
MPTELWSETRRAATVPRLAGGKRTLGDKEEGHGEEGRGSENRAVVYMPGCAAGLLYSGPEQVPKRNTASRPRLASSLRPTVPAFPIGLPPETLFGRPIGELGRFATA